MEIRCNKKILLLGAMPEEIKVYKKHLIDEFQDKYDIHLDSCGVGKTTAASATQKLISEYKPNLIIFTGMAGALESRLKIGDIGIGVAAIDADLDVRLWMPDCKRGEHPFTHDRLFYSDSNLREIAFQAPVKRLFDAYIATGSCFVDNNKKQKFLKKVNNDLTAEIAGKNTQPNLYDMESSAILQVAKMNNVPALAIRVVSDTLAGDAFKEFDRFISKATQNYVGVVKHVLENI